MSNIPKAFRDLWRTPDYLFAWASEQFGPFDIDLAASAENAKCAKFFTAEDDALQRPWADAGTCGWLNPPYSKIQPWVEKAISEAEQGFRTVMLIPTFNGEPRDALILENATDVVLIEGRVKFKVAHPDVKPSSNPRGSMLVVFDDGYIGPYCTKFDSVKRKYLEAAYATSRKTE